MAVAGWPVLGGLLAEVRAAGNVLAWPVVPDNPASRAHNDFILLLHCRAYTTILPSLLGRFPPHHSRYTARRSCLSHRCKAPDYDNLSRTYTLLDSLRPQFPPIPTTAAIYSCNQPGHHSVLEQRAIGAPIMESQVPQDPLDSLIPPPDISLPVTPEPSHASIAESTASAVSKVQSARVENASNNMTPPPSTQVPSSNRGKTRTPTPPVSHISTPPPTIELPAQSQASRVGAGAIASMTTEELQAASPDDLRATVSELQASLLEAKMSAAHHKLQYQMLAQESAANIERMAVEARMAQSENEVIHYAEQARAAALPAQRSPAQAGTIPVQKDLYQRMCREIQLLREANTEWKAECDQRDKVIDRQDDQIASLTDKVTLMRDRIRESREHLHRHRTPYMSSRADQTPRSVYSTPHRSHASSQMQAQPFAALLQASEMASQESARSVPGRSTTSKKGHARNTHSTSSLPATPRRGQKLQQHVYQTPQDRRKPMNVPLTAPMPRTSAMRTPDVYSQQPLPMPPSSYRLDVQSDGTVSASDHENDSEAETDIIDADEVTESQASRAASQMLRTSQEHQKAKRDSFKGSGMLQPTGSGLRQSKLFGAVRKSNVDRDDEPPAKRARTGETGIGLGIAGVRH